MKSSPEEMFSEQPFITFVQQVINRSKAFGCALNFQEWRYGQEEQIWEGLFGCRLSWGVSLIAAERTSFLLQPDGAMAFAASTSQEREGGGGSQERNRDTDAQGGACEKQASPKTPSEVQNEIPCTVTAK